MSAQKGRDLLLKLDANGDGTFTTIAGLRSKQISFSADTIDVTHQDSPQRWRELLGEAGVRRASISGSGVFVDAASDAEVRQLFFSGALKDWQVIIPDFGVATGKFQITALDFAGQFDAEVTFDIALESAGEITFAVAV